MQFPVSSAASSSQLRIAHDIGKTRDTGFNRDAWSISESRPCTGPRLKKSLVPAATPSAAERISSTRRRRSEKMSPLPVLGPSGLVTLQAFKSLGPLEFLQFLFNVTFFGHAWHFEGKLKEVIFRLSRRYFQCPFTHEMLSNHIFLATDLPRFHSVRQIGVQ